MPKTAQTHTPGPLEIYADGNHIALVIGKRLRIVVDKREDLGDPMPFARLIAAAPDGKTLAEHIVAMADDAYLVAHPEWEVIVTEARTFIAKAEGRE